MAELAIDPPAGARELARSSRDLLLHRAAKVVTPNDFTDLDQIRQRLAAFEERYNARAGPFDCTFGRDDLDKLITRIERPEAA